MSRRAIASVTAAFVAGALAIATHSYAGNTVPAYEAGHAGPSGGPVQLSFFGGLDLGQVASAERVAGPGFNVAALIDLAGVKAAVVTQRAETRDYLDIHALLTLAHISLPSMLAAASVIHGSEFNPLLSLKAIAYHDDLALASLPHSVRHDLIEAVRTTKLEELPDLPFERRRGVTT